MTKEEKIDLCVEIAKKSMPLSENQEAQLRLMLNQEPIEKTYVIRMGGRGNGKNLQLKLYQEVLKQNGFAPKLVYLDELQNKPAL